MPTLFPALPKIYFTWAVHSYDYDKLKRILDLSKEEWKALDDLRNDNSIIVRRPDKGNGFVIVNRLDYLNKVNRKWNSWFPVMIQNLGGGHTI